MVESTKPEDHDPELAPEEEKKATTEEKPKRKRARLVPYVPKEGEEIEKPAEQSR
jgi:hypothetical protein